MKTLKKCIVVLVAALLCAAAFSGCAEAPSGITMKTLRPTYPNDVTSIEVRLRNYSNSAILYGVAFSVEKYDNGEWEVLLPDEPVFFILVGLVLRPFGSAKLSCKVDLFYSGVLETGNYRIVKSFTVENPDIPGRFPLYANFEVV
ncbi:MAG: hypothetical protein FWH03_04610 [Firmicutes bacterium]|nr:hypothetical protein [Bacillota bacterium]